MLGVQHEAGIHDPRSYRIGFLAWKPTKIDVGGEAVEADERGHFAIPVAPTPDAVTTFSLTNADGQSASYELKLLEFYPWAEEDLSALRSGGDFARKGRPKNSFPACGAAVSAALGRRDACTTSWPRRRMAPYRRRKS